ncbi:DUF3120 domain-containing protein [Microcoleus sp. FACHB-1515]|nr:DUF3120 domain-containing protein [Microcoleus sp. FACHB-1515]MBD2090401.1 DUF3120 domain-containing protein [Microcoleus sp. FACHB-1515]
MLAAAVFLISVPVFIEAPLVRYLPTVSLLMTLAWLGFSWLLWRKPSTHVWGDLLFGFSWTWLAGSIYWGWLRWEPMLHLPVEAIGLPAAAYYLARGQGKVGHWFYLGSLFGTAVTDVYFYLVNLIPHWRQLMQVQPEQAAPILAAALSQIQTPWGAFWAVMLVGMLLGVGILPLRHRQLHWWAFGGSVLSTLLVDGLFWIAAMNA